MPNVLRADFYKRRGVAGLEKVTVIQKFANHTIALLDFAIGSKQEYLLPPENIPVEVTWGRSPVGVRTYYGYVNHYETVTAESGEAMTRMVLVGTSRTMNSTNTSSWSDTTRSAIARDIAARHRLRSVVHAHPFIVENWATGTRTDYQALKALADEAGYRLWVDGATLYFLDPTKMLRSASSMTTPLIPERDVRHITIMGGSNIPGELVAAKRRVQFGLDYRTNEFFEATSGNTSHPTEVVTTAVNTYSEAQEISDAAERKQRDYYVLKATVEGDARIQPGTLSRFDSGRVNRDQAGLWLVGEARHEITATDFTSQIAATRGMDMQPLSRTPSTVRGASDLTRAVVRDGVTWEATLQEHVHV